MICSCKQATRLPELRLAETPAACLHNNPTVSVRRSSWSLDSVRNLVGIEKLRRLLKKPTEPTDPRRYKNKFRRLPPFIWDEFAEKYRKGMSAAEISRRLSVSKPSTLYQLRRRNIPIRSSSQTQKDKVMSRYRNGGKICSHCDQIRSPDNFYKCSTKADGRMTVCKICYSEKEKERRKDPTHRNRLREYHKKWMSTPRGKKKQKEYQKKSMAKVRSKFRSSISRAKKIDMDWNITEEQYSVLVSNSCHYCGGELPPFGTGLDRLDNDQGYFFHNVVPCCSLCNYARRDQFTPQEMEKFVGPAIRKIRKQRGEKL